MKVLHVSESFNRTSILKRGLLPTKVLLPNHLETWKAYNLCTEDDRILYTWQSCDKDAKFVKDMVFCKQFLHPRNALSLKNPNMDFSEILGDFMGSFSQMTYDVYEATVPDQKSFFIHEQTPTLRKECSSFGMPYEFSHNDKILQMYKEPLTDLKIVGEASFEYGKHNQYIVRVK